MPKLRVAQPTPPGLAMSYIPDPRIVDGGQITPKRQQGPVDPDDDPNMIKEGSTRQANAIYSQKLVRQWLYKGDIPRWTAEVTKWAAQNNRGFPYFFNKKCVPGSEDYKAPWTLAIPIDALQVPSRYFVEDCVVQITAKGREGIEYEVARCPLWAAIQIMQYHKFLEPRVQAEDVIKTFAPSDLRAPSRDGHITFYDTSSDFSDEDSEDYDDDYVEEDD